jgi:hypothetical protein
MTSGSGDQTLRSEFCPFKKRCSRTQGVGKLWRWGLPPAHMELLQIGDSVAWS